MQEGVVVLDCGSLRVHHAEVLHHPGDSDTQVTPLSCFQHTPQDVEGLHLEIDMEFLLPLSSYLLHCRWLIIHTSLLPSSMSCRYCVYPVIILITHTAPTITTSRVESSDSVTGFLWGRNSRKPRNLPRTRIVWTRSGRSLGWMELQLECSYIERVWCVAKRRYNLGIQFSPWQLEEPTSQWDMQNGTEPSIHSYTLVLRYLQNFSIEGCHQVMNEHIAVVRIYIQV